MAPKVPSITFRRIDGLQVGRPAGWMACTLDRQVLRDDTEGLEPAKMNSSLMEFKVAAALGFATAPLL